jgi:hypothetical protein
VTVRDGDTAEAHIAQWRAYADRRPERRPADVDELEDHLRDRIADLISAGLSEDEAFLVAVKRMGTLDALTREFAREHSDRLWKQLVLDGGPEEQAGEARRALRTTILFAAIAAVAVKLPILADVGFDFYLRNAGLLALAPLAAYFCWTRRPGRTSVVAVCALFVVGLLAANAYPLAADGPATVLTAVHLPIALWLVVGVAYTGPDWRTDSQRMNFIRFTGEWIVYYALIALGGGVLSALTLGSFAAIGVDGIEDFVAEWLLPCGAAGAVVVAAWLVEAKKSVVENMAPVLTHLFTPLFVAVLLALAVGILIVGGIDVSREVLILFDLLLVVVLGLLVYAISARGPDDPAGWLDAMQLVLVAATLVVDAIVLAAIAGRIGEFGFSANKTAALGENVILLVNLGWSSRLLYRLVRRGRGAGRLQRWQTRYLDVYAAWAWVVVLAFPLIFGT